MRFEFTEITHIRVHYFKSFHQVKSTQHMKKRFIEGNELKLT